MLGRDGAAAAAFTFIDLFQALAIAYVLSNKHVDRRAAS
jgi:hypothetical protein